MAYTNPTVADFKAYFVRDFVYGVTTSTVQDADITSGLNDAAINFNPALWADQASYNIGFLLLSAHFLCMNLRASSQGIAGQFEWDVQSKSVGNVSESFAIPQRILDNPEFSYLSKTSYGVKYLMFVLPQLSGQILIACGRTLP